MINTRTLDYLDKKETKKLANEVLKWCLNEFGNPLKTMEPEIKVSYNKRWGKYFGFYECRKITVMPLVCVTDDVFISTIVHEFKHFLQLPKLNQMSRYDKMSDEYDYSEHPYEVEAFEFEKQHGPRCLKFLRKKGIL